MMMKHSPWRITRRGQTTSHHERTAIVNAKGEEIVHDEDYYPAFDAEYAECIVRAANAHDDLLLALADAVDTIEQMRTHPITWWELDMAKKSVERARAAIAKARAKDGAS